MNEQHKKRISKFLSLVLRHKPEVINLTLDENGWASVDELMEKCAKHERSFTLEELTEIVETNDKKRFVFNEDKTRIRANQGHSID
ncbi:RNA 2'-phosphotransferase, partial [uncultured Chryseobacterium sp.]